MQSHPLPDMGIQDVQGLKHLVEAYRLPKVLSKDSSTRVFIMKLYGILMENSQDILELLMKGSRKLFNKAKRKKPHIARKDIKQLGKIQEIIRECKMEVIDKVL